MNVSYSIQNVLSAAEFVYDNNDIYENVQDAYERIINMMMDAARNDEHFTGTGGFLIMFDETLDGGLYAEVLVSPDLAINSMDNVYQTVEVV